MSILLNTDRIPFPMITWRFLNLRKVFAGNGCIMALTESGKVLQRVKDKELSADMESWQGVEDIAISQYVPALAVGLRRDGTCVVSEPALQRCSEISGINAGKILRQVGSWRDIVQIRVSDAIFALDRFGNVHCAELSDPGQYRDVEAWKRVTCISAGSQCAVFGVTAEGAVFCAGHNCVAGPRGDLREKLEGVAGVVDICATGAECQKILLAYRDGTVKDLDGNFYGRKHAGRNVFISNFTVAAIRQADGTVIFDPYWFPEAESLQKLQGRPLGSCAVGHVAFEEPFAIALSE